MKDAERLRKKFEEDLMKAEKEEAIIKQLPKKPDESEYPWSICIQSDEIWVSLEPERYRYTTPDEPQPFEPTLSDVLHVSEVFQTIPIRMYRYGCTSIDWHPPKRKTEEDGETIAPFILDADGACSFQEHTATIRWWSKLGDDVIRVAIKMRAPYTGELGRVTHTTASENTPGRRCGDILESRYSMPTNLDGKLLNRDGKPVASAHSITWWRDREHCGPGRYTVYFLPGLNNPTVADLVACLSATETNEG